MLESHPDESDMRGGNFCNTKFRVLLVSNEVLEVAREIEPASVVEPGLSESHTQFFERRWANIRALAELIDEVRPVVVMQQACIHISKHNICCMQNTALNPTTVFTYQDRPFDLGRRPFICFPKRNLILNLRPGLGPRRTSGL